MLFKIEYIVQYDFTEYPNVLWSSCTVYIYKCLNELGFYRENNRNFHLLNTSYVLEKYEIFYYSSHNDYVHACLIA